MSYNVLIVDDSKSMRRVIRKTLEISGFQIGEYMEAANGREALELLENNWIDLILSDIHMPVMDGFGFLQALKEKNTNMDIPVIFITTEANEDRLNELMALGARGYIRKPFRPEAVSAFLGRIMGETDDHTMGTNSKGCDF
ncbi:MAG: response regulator [Syntrophobacter sp.]